MALWNLVAQGIAALAAPWQRREMARARELAALLVAGQELPIPPSGLFSQLKPASVRAFAGTRQYAVTFTQLRPQVTRGGEWLQLSGQGLVHGARAGDEELRVVLNLVELAGVSIRFVPGDEDSTGTYEVYLGHLEVAWFNSPLGAAELVAGLSQATGLPGDIRQAYAISVNGQVRPGPPPAWVRTLGEAMGLPRYPG